MGNFAATVKVTLKDSVLDPQGKAVHHALESIGFQKIKDVRVGKCFEVSLQAPDRAKADQELKGMCEKLFSNPVIEKYVYEIREV